MQCSAHIYKDGITVGCLIVLNKHYMVSIRVSIRVPNRGGMHSVYISIIISHNISRVF